MASGNKNLRYCSSATGKLYHLGTQFRLFVNTDFLIAYLFIVQHVLSANTIRTIGFGVNSDLRHHYLLDFTSGKLAPVQLPMPPCNTDTALKPCFNKLAAAFCAVMPA